jgi:hypothetical protein
MCEAHRGIAFLARHPQLPSLTVHRTRLAEEFLMFRLSLYVLGVSAMVAGWAAFRNQQMKKPMPVQKAASMLQQAWADHRTRA